MINACYIGDCIDGMLKMMDHGLSPRVCVTSPPYWGLRDYGHDMAYGLEESFDEYLEKMAAVFAAVHELLADDGTLWLNMGDAYVTRPNGGIGRTSTINGQSTQEAYRQAQAYRGKKQPGQTGLKHKDLMGQPWRLAFALQEMGWYLRQDIIWHKPSPMPESVRDRCTKSHEYLFLLSKSPKYFYDFDAMQEPVTGNANARGAGVNPKAKEISGWDTGPGAHDTIKHAASPKYQDGDSRHRTKQGLAASERKFRPRQNESFSGAVTEIVDTRNRRSVWTVASEPYADAHFATFPRKLIEPCILAGSEPGDIVLDPFMGSGTTAQVAEHLGRKWVGCEINPEYVELQKNRLKQTSLDLR